VTALQGPQCPKAYSYVRFSTPEQAYGDSLRRQTETAREYASKHGLELDETLTFRDPGISAFRGLNAEAGNLGKFLEAVRSGLIEPGSFLLVESLDRISRQTVMRAVATMQEIVGAGINLVDLSDGGKLYNIHTLDSDGGMSFIMMALRFLRAHEESALKSRRLLAVYEAKRAKAKSNSAEPFTRMLPGWLRWDEQARIHMVIPERAAVLQSIFSKADEGWGRHRIARWLNEQNVPTWGGRGLQRKAECWHRSYIQKLLTNPAVIGTFTPHQKRDDGNGKGRRQALDAIENYWPSVVDRDQFERVAVIARAPAPRGRNAFIRPASIFAGVLRCSRCNGLVTRVSKGEYVYLVCSKANRKGVNACNYQAVRYGDVEHALVVNAEAMIREAPRGMETAELDAEITNLDAVVDVLSDQASDLADELMGERSGVSRRRLQEKE
jgi:DNA invertase Pin-like site-specific DNA recombinase